MDIREKLRAHIGQLFSTTAQTRAILELKEELLANCVERYTDLTLQGINPADAYANVVENIGNVDELVSATQSPTSPLPGVDIATQKKLALTRSICTGLYMLAGFVLVTCTFLSDISEWIFMGGFCAAIIMCIVPTVILVYTAYAYPSYNKDGDDVVENFKQFNNDTTRNKEILDAVHSVIWLAAVIVYLLVSFFTRAWGLTWIVFPITALISSIATTIFKIREIKP